MPEHSLYDAKELLQAIAKGDETAFPKLYNQYMPQVYRFAIRFVHKEQLAEEVVQDVFIKIWLHQKSLPLIERFEAYLHIMTRNTCFKHLQKLANEERARSEWAVRSDYQGKTDENTIVANDYKNHLQQYISKLPAQQGKVYTMHLQGFKNEEIAKCLAISKNTVRVHLAVASKTVRSYFAALKNALLPLLLSLPHLYVK